MNAICRAGGVLRTVAALALVFSGSTLAPLGAGAGETAGLAGGEAVGRGLFVTYSDQDTVLEGGTIAPPDFNAPVARASVDLTGHGSALAAFAYSPYSDAAGVINAFGGTSLPVGSLFEPSRAKVTGRPPQEQHSAAPGPVGAGVLARLAEGPTAEASTLAAGVPGPGLAVRIGDLRSVVRREGPNATSTVSIVLRAVSIGDVLTFESVVLTASAAADGALGQATATTVVEGVAVAGQAVRLTPKGLEPDGAAPPDFAALAASGIEVVAAGEAVTAPGGAQAEARSTGPRLRLRTADGRMLTVVLGEALASSAFVPPSGG